jgi:hypothetical protein
MNPGSLLIHPFVFNLNLSLLFSIVQATTLYSGQGFGVADAGGDIVQHDLGKMENATEYAGFYFTCDFQTT